MHLASHWAAGYKFIHILPINCWPQPASVETREWISMLQVIQQIRMYIVHNTDEAQRVSVTVISFVV